MNEMQSAYASKLYIQSEYCSESLWTVSYVCFQARSFLRDDYVDAGPLKTRILTEDFTYPPRMLRLVAKIQLTSTPP